MPSVTEILNTFPERELIEWKLRVGPKKVKEVSEEALMIGKTVDELIQADVKGLPIASHGLPTQDTPIYNCWLGWKKFKQAYPHFIPSLVGVQHELRRDEITGHPDFLLQQNRHREYTSSLNERGVCDLKCATQIRPNYWTQVAAYSWLQNSTENANFLAILRLDKVTGSYEYAELTDPDEIDYEVQVWLNYKVLYEHRQRVAERSRTMREDVAYDGVS